MVEYYFANAEIKDILLTDIKVDPQKRIRKSDTTTKSSVSHKALKSSMEKYGQLQSITLSKDHKLIAGFERYSVAWELGWKTIRCRIFLMKLTKLDELLLEITENYARKDFTSLEFFAGLVLTKMEYEKAHPEIKRGKGRWSKSVTKHEKNNTASNAVLKNQVLPFVKAYHKFFGIAERTLFNYVRIGEAYKKNKFNQETISLFNEGELTQTQLLDILRKLENKKIIESNLTQKNESPSNYKMSEKDPVIKMGGETIKSEEIQAIKQKTPEERENFIKELRKSVIESFVESGRPKKEIKAPQNNKAIISSQNPKDNKNVEKKPSFENNKREDLNQSFECVTCFTCPKATPIAIKCKLCGNYAQKVMCDIDVIDSKRTLRDADQVQCEKASLPL